MRVLAVTPEHVDPARTGMTGTAFLLYCYYGALIHIGALKSESCQCCSAGQQGWRRCWASLAMMLWPHMR